MSAERGELEAELRNAWTAELRSWWRIYARDYLGGAMRQPSIVVLDTERKVGHWDRETRTIGISARHVLECPWRVVLETLRHEMAHQYVDEVLRVAQPAHGPAFRRACELLRVDPRATVADAAGPREEDHASARLLRRIEKLLSLADSPNENEAEAAFRKARRLLVEHGLEVRGGAPAFAIRDLGPLKGRHAAWEFVLANILDGYFAVDVVWSHGFDPRRGKRGTVLRAFGTETALEMADYVYSFLTGLLQRSWADYRAARGIRGNRDRQRYYHGVLRGFQQKLAADDRTMRDQEGLIPVDDPALQSFVRYHCPRLHTVACGRTVRTRAHADGERAGREIVVSKPLGHAGGHGGLLEHGGGAPG